MRVIAKGGVRLISAALIVLLFTACNDGQPAPAEGPPSNPTTAPAGPPTTDGPAIDEALFARLGQRDFITANENELLSAGTNQRGANSRGSIGVEDDGDFADGAAAGDPDADGGGGEAVPDLTREIVEADVFKLEGDLLYVLNRWRGLVIIDVSDPDDLRVRGRLPFQAIPIEMYVRDGRAYVLSSDYFTYWQYDPEADPHGFHGSQVMIIDVDDPDHPVNLGGQHIDGELTDSRMVGDVLYTVSKRRPDYWRYNTADWEDRTWVASLNIADPADIREIDRETFNGTSTLIHVAHHAIFVAAQDPNFYLRDPNFQLETLVTYVDISDAEGDLVQRGRVYVPGHIADKFKMDWHEGVFRVLSQNWSQSNSVAIHMVRTDRPDDLEIDASLDLPVDNSGLRASRIDGLRAFLMTNRYTNRTHIQELHTLDLSDPDAPRLADTLRTDIDMNHMQITGDRMLVLGRKRVPDGRYTNSRSTLAVYDVADLDAPHLVSETTVGEGWSNSEANQDYKALKVFPELNLILLPLRFWDGSRHFNGVGLIDWTDDDRLIERGRVENQGGVRRAFPVGDRILAVGELSISAIDATDRDDPQVTDLMHLVRNVHDIFDVQGLQVQVLTDVYDSTVRLEVRPFSEHDDTPPVATLDLPYTWAPNIFRDGDVLHLLGHERGQNGQMIRNVDLSDPRNPRLRGELELESEYARIYNRGYSFYARYWSPAAGLALRNQILPVTYRHIVEDANGRRDFESELRFIDLRDIDAPRIADGAVPMNDYPFVNKVTHGNVLFSSHVEQATTEAGESLLYHVRAYVDRVDVTDPDNPVQLPSVNVPGFLVDASDDGRLIYTVDYQWDDYGRRRNSLNVLRFNDAGDDAELVEVIPVVDQIHRTALRAGWLSEGGRPAGWHDRTIWLATHKYPWWGVRSDTVSSRQPYTHLQRLSFGEDGELVGATLATLYGYHFNLLDIEDGQAYLGSTGPYGLLVLDVVDAANPVITFAARTIGYLSRIVRHEDAVYAPMSMYGVHRHVVGDTGGIH